jgi:GTPase SAR1 family protein
MSNGTVNSDKKGTKDKSSKNESTKKEKEEVKDGKFTAFLKLAVLVITAMGKVKEFSDNHGVSDWLVLQFKNLQKISGKRIGVIGATASGKNSLITKLRGEVIDSEYSQTRGVESVSSYKVKFPVPGHNDIYFKASKSINVGGERDERDRHWAEACRSADIVFYLLDAKRLIDERDDTLFRFEEDVEWIAKTGISTGKDKFKSTMKLAIVLNKVDFFDYENNEIGDLNLKLAPILQEIDLRAKKILGTGEGWLLGVYPLSLTHDFLFRSLFLVMIKDISEIID